MGIIVFKYGSLLSTFVWSHVRYIAGGLDNYMYLEDWRTPKLGERVLWRTDAASVLLRKLWIKAGHDLAELHARAFRAALSRARANAVLAEFGYSGALMWASCRELGIPLVVHFHGTDLNRRELVDKHIAGYRGMFSYAAALVAVSQHDRQRLVELGAPANKIHVIPCGAEFADELPSRKSAGGEYNIISVARFAPVKAPQLTLLAYQRYLALGGEGRLHMVGDGPLLPFCETLAKGLGIADRVTFHGRLPHEQALELLARSQLYVQHSVTAPDGDCEGMPVSLMEAAGYGLPIVTTRTGGIPEMIEQGKNGYLVDQYDVNGMARRMYDLWRRPEVAATMGRRARVKAQTEYDVDKQSAKLKELILSVAPR